jgi:prepilin-type N-terminal cleavage/methylation domain-containing protein
MRKIRRKEAGFTLMELMVVIVIVAILAAVAVPLYINYVKDAQRTEAKGAIGAIVTAEQVNFQRSGTYVPYGDADFATPPAPPDPVLSCDVTEAQRNWFFDVTAADRAGFTIIAKGRQTGNNTLQVKLVYSRAADPVWEEK